MYIVSLSVQTVWDKATLLERRSLIEIMSLRCLLKVQRCVRSQFLYTNHATEPLRLKLSLSLFSFYVLDSNLSFCFLILLFLLPSFLYFICSPFLSSILCFFLLRSSSFHVFALSFSPHFIILSCLITVFTKTRHWPLSWARWFQFTPSHRKKLWPNSISCNQLGNRLKLCHQHFIIWKSHRKLK